MNQEFAVDALISLTSKSPYSVCADGTVSTLERVIQEYFINKKPSNCRMGMKAINIYLSREVKKNELLELDSLLSNHGSTTH
jgi:hypothetical protein